MVERARSGKVTVVGAGSYGSTTAQRFAEYDVFDTVVITDVVALLTTGSAYFAPSAAAARMARAVMEDSGAIMPVCAWVDGEYGISGVYPGVEAEIGRTGVRRVVEGDPSASELSGLRVAAEAVRAKQADVADL